MLNWSHCNVLKQYIVRVHAGLPDVHCCWNPSLVRWKLTASSRQQHAHCGLMCHSCAGKRMQRRWKRWDLSQTGVLCLPYPALYSFSTLRGNSSGYSFDLALIVPRLHPYFYHRVRRLGTRLSPFPVRLSVPFPYHSVWDGIRVEAVCPLVLCIGWGMKWH